MFSEAYEIASKFTHPLIVIVRFFDGSVDCILGAFTILNDKGWAVTVAHLFEPFFAYKQHKDEIDNYNEQFKAIHDDQHLDTQKRRKRKSHLKTNPKWITNISYWWGKDGVRYSEVRAMPEGDIAIVHLEPFDPYSISQYPVIKNPNNLKPGTSLCKLGFPFHQVKASFDEKTNNFSLEPGALPVPRFPIEGIYTRNVIAGKSKDNKYDIKFIETSSPGLRGQSGGPIFDVKGIIWGIQSKTTSLPLGFNPKVVKNGREYEENQFLNVGWGIHLELCNRIVNRPGY